MTNIFQCFCFDRIVRCCVRRASGGPSSCLSNFSLLYHHLFQPSTPKCYAAFLSRSIMANRGRQPSRAQCTAFVYGMDSRMGTQRWQLHRSPSAAAGRFGESSRHIVKTFAKTTIMPCHSLVCSSSVVPTRHAPRCRTPPTDSKSTHRLLCGRPCSDPRPSYPWEESPSLAYLCSLFRKCVSSFSMPSDDLCLLRCTHMQHKDTEFGLSLNTKLLPCCLNILF